MSKNSPNTLILVEICMFWQIIAFFSFFSIFLPSAGRFCPFFDDFNFFLKKSFKKKKLVKITNYSLINQSNWSKTIFYNTTLLNMHICVKDMS